MAKPNPTRHPGEVFCNRCKQFLQATEFGKNAQRRTGLSHLCRQCVRDRHAEWRRSVGIKTREEYIATIHKPGICSDCKELKPLWMFGKNNKSLDGRAYACKACYQKRNIRYWWINVKGDPEKHAKVKARTNAYMRTYRYRKGSYDPAVRQRHIVRTMVTLAIQGGFLKRSPCEKCGDPKVQGHHDDYSKPLEVRWLCRLHHNEFHSHR